MKGLHLYFLGHPCSQEDPGTWLECGLASKGSGLVMFL